jgi:hypothetical protein
LSVVKVTRLSVKEMLMLTTNAPTGSHPLRPQRSP